MGAEHSGLISAGWSMVGVVIAFFGGVGLAINRMVSKDKCKTCNESTHRELSEIKDFVSDTHGKVDTLGLDVATIKGSLGIK